MIIDKLNYLDETKQQIKGALNTDFNSQIQDDDTFRSYVSKISDIYTNWPKVTGEDTSLTLNNTKKGKMVLGLNGNGGKNLMKIKYTIDRGITTTVNSDGSITANGKATDTFAYIDTGENVSLVAGTYYLSLVNALSVNLRVFLYNGGSQIGTITLNAGTTSTSLTTNQNITSYSVIIYGLTVDTQYDITMKLQLEKNDSSATSFEPYGASVTGNNSIKVSNSMFDRSKAVLGTLQASGSVSASTTTYTTDFTEINPSKSYYLPAKGSIRGKYFDNNKNPLNTTSYNDFGTIDGDTATILTNIPSDAKYIRTTINNDYIDNFYIILNGTTFNETTYLINIGTTKLYTGDSIENNNGWEIVRADTTTETITDDTLIEQLNNLEEQAVSYDNATNITQTNADLGFIVSASALMKGGN